MNHITKKVFISFMVVICVGGFLYLYKSTQNEFIYINKKGIEGYVIKKPLEIKLLDLPNNQQVKFHEKFVKTTQLDWEKLLFPCNKKTEWIYKNTNKENATSASNTIYVVNKLPNTDIYKIKLFTADYLGRKKTIGGDSWLVRISNDIISFNIDVIDSRDGTYEALFSVPQAGNYSTDIILEYSLCDSIIDPPLNWFRQGTFQGGFQKKLPESLKDYINNKLPRKTIEITQASKVFYLCNHATIAETCVHINGQYGFWENQKYINCHQFNEEQHELQHVHENVRNKNLLSNKLNTLLIFGDSLGERFHQSIRKTEICQKLFKKCKIVSTWIYVLGKYETGYQENHGYNYDKKDFNETIFLQGITDSVVKDRDMYSNKSVVVINFGLHPLTNLQFQKMKNLFFLFLDLVANIKRNFGKSSPLFIWKTITQPAQTKLYRYPRDRFMTSQRARLWNEFTIVEACKRNLPILHVYHMSASFRHGALDQSHYDNSAFYSAENALYNYLMSYDFK